MLRKLSPVFLIVGLAFGCLPAQAQTAPTITTTTGVLDLEPNGATPHTTSFTIVTTGSPVVTVTNVSLDHNGTVTNPATLPWLTVSQTGVVTGTLIPTDGSLSTGDTVTLQLNANNGTPPAATGTLVITLGTVINTTSEGAVTYTIPATVAAQTYTNYYAAPLTLDPVYTGAVTTPLASNVITVTGTPWTANQYQFSSTGTPYFVKILTGSQTGRVMLITANTTSGLTVDTTDHTTQTVPLTTSGFALASGDTFEIFQGDTLGTLLGNNTTTYPLILNGGTASLSADTVGIYSPSQHLVVAYYFNTSANQWEQSGATVSANNTIIYPYSSFSITRRPNEPQLTFTLMGRVPEVNRLIKTAGSNQAVYDSTGYPVDMTLGGLQLTPWTAGASSVTADTLAVWNPSQHLFNTYFQLSTDSNNWHLSSGGPSQNSVVIPAGTTVIYNRRASLSGAASYLTPPAPYTLGQ
jgi:hypothetical protein